MKNCCYSTSLHISEKPAPDNLCIELKSLKLYIWSFRDRGAFHEDVTNKILNDLVATISPRYMNIVADFNVRGGIHTTITVEHIMDGWSSSIDKCD